MFIKNKLFSIIRGVGTIIHTIFYYYRKHIMSLHFLFYSKCIYRFPENCDILSGIVLLLI